MNEKVKINDLRACENCGSVHVKGTLKHKVDFIASVAFKVCPRCHDNWEK